MLWLIGYSLARALAVAPSLGPYGINPWIFLSLDVGSALPLSYAQLRLVHALRTRDPRRVQGWVSVVIVSFLTPYAYLVLGAGRPLPAVAYAVVGVLVLVLGGATAWRVRQAAYQGARPHVRRNPPSS